MELGNISEEIDCRIIICRQKRITETSESYKIDKVADDHIEAVVSTVIMVVSVNKLTCKKHDDGSNYDRKYNRLHAEHSPVSFYE